MFLTFAATSMWQEGVECSVELGICPGGSYNTGEQIARELAVWRRLTELIAMAFVVGYGVRRRQEFGPDAGILRRQTGCGQRV
jgi:hypothetical protein